MAIGDTITQAIPTVGTLGTGYATAVNAFLTEVKTRLESKVAFSSLLASGTLDMLGKPLANAQYVSFASQGVVPSGSPSGRFEYYNGEMYVVTAAGAVQLTSAGALSVTSAGGIGGDYGGANPAQVRFVDADERYDFYDDFSLGEWGYVRALGVDIAGGVTSAVRARLAYGGVGSYVLTLPATLPAANTSVLVVNNAGQMFHNDSTNTITNDLVLGAGAEIQHTNKVLTLSFLDAVSTDESNAGFTLDAAPVVIVGKTPSTAAGSRTLILTVPLLPGDRVKSITIDHKGNIATDDFTMNVYTVLGGEATLIAASPFTTSDIGVAWASSTYDITDTVLASGQALIITVTPAQASVYFGRCAITYDHP